MQFQEIENRHARGLTACPGRGGDGDQRFQGAWDWTSLADGLVDVGQKISRVGGVQVGGLGRVHRRATADSHITVKLALRREPDGLLEGHVRWLDTHAVKEGSLNPFGAQCLQDNGHRLTVQEMGVGQDHHPLCA